MNSEIKLVKKAGKLVHRTKRDTMRWEVFTKSLEEGQVIHLFAEVLGDDQTIGQLANVHAKIRALAAHTGNEFEIMKMLVKDKAGLCVNRVIEGKEYLSCKSFAECSFDEVGLAIQAAIELGKQVNLNLE